MLCALLCLSCSHRALHEAQSVVAEADSLRTVGQLYPDSTQLAQAYTTLKHWQNIRPDDYARACYYYGRLLRSAEHYPEAMTCFINATHSRSTDYHILGRVYSNMADLCQLEGNYDMAYDMHVLATDCFKKDGNLRAYYYGINNMAVQRAQQKNKQAVDSLLSFIESECSDSLVLADISETKAIVFRNVGEYDSAIYYANALLAHNRNCARAYKIKAQAFSFLHQGDSSILYASLVVANSKSLFDLNNMYYILTHDDESQSKDSIRHASAKRSDIQKLIAIRQGELSHAVEILQQDMHRKPDRRWLYVLVGFMMLVGGGLGLLYTYRRSRRIKKDAEGMRATLEKKCEAIVQLSDKQQTSTIYWNDYSALCYFMDVNMNGIVNKLLQQNPNLTEQNIRLSITILIGFSYSRSADLLRLSKASISKSKQILAAKLGTDIKSLRSYLMDMACQNA